MLHAAKLLSGQWFEGNAIAGAAKVLAVLRLSERTVDLVGVCAQYVSRRSNVVHGRWY